MITLQIRSFASVRRVTQDVLLEANTSRDEVLSLLSFVSAIETYDVKGRPVAELSRNKRWWAYIYKALPINLIPSDIVLAYHFSYTGPCGAKSRLLASMLRSAGYKARLNGLFKDDNTPLHTIVEVWLRSKWIPLDPTFGLYFENWAGDLASTEEISEDFTLYISNIENYERKEGNDYPEDEYVYTNVSSVTVFYSIITLMKVFGLLESIDNIPDLYEELASVFPEAWINFDLGSPYIYDEPYLLFFLFCITPAICLGFVIFRESK